MTSYLLTGPAIEPVTLAEAKAFARVDDDTEDALIAALIASARIHVEAQCGRALIDQSWRLVLDAWPLDGEIALPVSPAASLTAVTAYDAEDAAHVIDPEQFHLDGKAMPALLLAPATITGMPLLRDRRGIEIDYAAGFGATAEDVPADLRQAILLFVAYWFENRDSSGAADAAAPVAAERLLAPYRRVRI